MKIALGADHAGFAIKEAVKAALRIAGHDVNDFGTTGEASCDYPDFAAQVARAVGGGQAERGVLVCGTGIGMGMVANKIAGVRAAVCHDALTVEMSRRHNDANVLCLGARVVPDAAAQVGLVQSWLATPFDGGRHEGRVAKINRMAPNG